jgi:hypothetical protein
VVEGQGLNVKCTVKLGPRGMQSAEENCTGKKGLSRKDVMREKARHWRNPYHHL